MYGEQGFKAVHKTVHLAKFIGKGFSIFGRGVLYNQKCYVIILVHRVPSMILTVYLSYLDQVLLPIAVTPFIYWNKAKKI